MLTIKKIYFIEKKCSAKEYLTNLYPPFKGASPFPHFHPVFRKGGPPFWKGGWVRRVDRKRVEEG